jgi:hypothetical protein
MNIPRIIPPSQRRCADVAREARATHCRCVVYRNRVVLLPRKPVEQPA